MIKKAENHSNHRDNYQPLKEIILKSFQLPKVMLFFITLTELVKQKVLFYD